jgi:hypothetical protein
MNEIKIAPSSSAQLNNILLTDITIKYNTDHSFIEWCKLYISLSPNTLQNIIDTTRHIILDNNRVDVVDIPNMILLIVTNIQKDANRYDIVSSTHIISLSKLIMYTIIDYELFTISPILKNNIVIEAMINSCLELVQINLSTSTSFTVTVEKKEDDFWDWISNFFCFWKK